MLLSSILESGGVSTTTTSLSTVAGVFALSHDLAAVDGVDNCFRFRYSLIDNLRFGATGDAVLTCGFNRGSLLCARVSNLGGVGVTLAVVAAIGVVGSTSVVYDLVRKLLLFNSVGGGIDCTNIDCDRMAAGGVAIVPSNIFAVAALGIPYGMLL